VAENRFSQRRFSNAFQIHHKGGTGVIPLLPDFLQRNTCFRPHAAHRHLDPNTQRKDQPNRGAADPVTDSSASGWRPSPIGQDPEDLLLNQQQMVRDLPERPPPRFWLKGALLRSATLKLSQELLPPLLKCVERGLQRREHQRYGR
jgi:hypothetical protein